MALSDATLGALAALVCTSAGAFAVIPIKKIGPLAHSIILAFAAGVMFYSAIEMLITSHLSSGDISVLLGLAIGIAGLALAEKALPHIHLHLTNEELSDKKKKTMLIVGTIALHNIPEGFAIGSAFAGSSPLGWFVTTSIALQDIPEGALVSAPLAIYGMSRWSSIFYGILSGVVEAISAILAYLFLSIVNTLVPLALSFSAGAMAYVIFAELLPDAFEEGRERSSTIAFIAGAAFAFIIASIFAI